MTLGPGGADAIEFMLSPNLGQPPMALARIASGGELSRVMLALKRLEAQRRRHRHDNLRRGQRPASAAQSPRSSDASSRNSRAFIRCYA